MAIPERPTVYAPLSVNPKRLEQTGVLQKTILGGDWIRPTDASTNASASR